MEDPESYKFSSILSTLFQSLETSDVVYLATLSLLIIGLLFLSGLISASEIAFFSLETSDLKEIKNKDPQKGKLISSLLQTPKRLLATILIANNAANISLVIISSLLVVFFQQYGGSPELYLFIQIVIVTSILLLFGEIIPKVYANMKYKTLVVKNVKFIFALYVVLKGISLLLVKLSKKLDFLLKEERKNLSVDELSKVHEMIQDYQHNEEEQKMLDRILELGNSDVKSIMQPRTEITAINSKSGFDEVKKIIKNSGYSRIPVFEDSIDNIVGILFIKDLLSFIPEKDNFDWMKIIKSPFYFPENKKLDDALSEFQEKKTHIAIVVDEYGGTLGLVTLEDVIEEVVGEIRNEFDDDELEYSKLSDDKFVLDAKIQLKDLCRITEIDLNDFEDHKGDSETIAGFILEQKGGFPVKGEMIQFKNYKFTIEGIDRRRIKRVRLEILEKIDDEYTQDFTD